MIEKSRTKRTIELNAGLMVIKIVATILIISLISVKTVEVIKGKNTENEASTSVTVSTESALRAYLTSSANYTITLSANITINDEYITVSSGIKEIVGNGYTLYINDAWYNSDQRRGIWVIGDGTQLTIKNLKINGYSSELNSQCYAVLADQWGELIIENCEIKNATQGVHNGSAGTGLVYVYDSLIYDCELGVGSYRSYVCI